MAKSYSRKKNKFITYNAPHVFSKGDKNILRKYWLGVIFFSFVTTIFFILFLASCFDLVRANESVKWPSTMGEIISYNAEFKTSVKGLPMCVPVVAYKYAISDKAYYGDKIAFYPLDTSGSDCASGADEFWPKKKIVIAYDPKDPAFSILWRGARIENYTHIFIFGLLFCGMIMYGLLVFGMSSSEYRLGLSKQAPLEEIQKEIKEDPRQEKFWN